MFFFYWWSHRNYVRGCVVRGGWYRDPALLGCCLQLGSGSVPHLCATGIINSVLSLPFCTFPCRSGAMEIQL